MWQGEGGDDNPFADPAVQAASKATARAASPPPAKAGAAEPVWLKSQSPPPGPPQPPAPSAPARPAPATTAPATSQPQAAAPAATGAQQSSVPPGQVPKLVTYVRIANFVLCCLMCTAAILTVIMPASVKPAAWVLSFYVLAFSCLLCCFEFQLRQVATIIANNFGFLYDAKSRMIFLIFVGVLCFSLGVMGKVVGALMIVNALFNVYVMCKYPQLQKYRPTTAEEEAAAYLQRNPQVAQRATAAVANAAIDQARRNPEAAKAAVSQGAASWL